MHRAQSSPLSTSSLVVMVAAVFAHPFFLLPHPLLFIRLKPSVAGGGGIGRVDFARGAIVERW